MTPNPNTVAYVWSRPVCAFLMNEPKFLVAAQTPSTPVLMICRTIWSGNKVDRQYLQLFPTQLSKVVMDIICMMMKA